MEAAAKTKNILLAHYQTVFDIAQKNGVQMQPLSEQMEALRHLNLRVPVIGASNVGKSTLLNALLSYPVLPTGMGAETIVPTLLSYGEPLLMVQRDDTAYRAGLGELRSKYFDTTGVCGLHAFYPSSFLQTLDGLQLVDMPSFDVMPNEQEAALVQALTQSFGCVLLISAEEPVLKESVCRCLSALRLRDIPFYILLTKCDKVTPAARQEGLRFCCQTLQEQLQVENVPVLCVQAGVTPEIAPAQRLLETLNQKADALCYARYSEQLVQQSTDLIEMLRMLSLQKEVAVAEIECRTQDLRQRSEALERVIADWETELLQKLPRYQEMMVALIAEKTTAFAPVIETEIALKHTKAEKTYDEIVSLATALVKSELEPILQKHLRALRATVVYHFAQQGGEIPPALLSSLTTWHADAALTQPTLLACCEAQMHQTQLRAMLEKFYADMPAKPRAKAVRARLQQTLLPQISQEMQVGIGETTSRYCAQLCTEVRALFQARYDALNAQLAQTIALCSNQMSQQQEGLANAAADIASLRDVVQQLSPPTPEAHDLYKHITEKPIHRDRADGT